MCITDCDTSKGFGIKYTEDEVVADKTGLKRKLVCGTEKGKHKSKNHRTTVIVVL